MASQQQLAAAHRAQQALLAAQVTRDAVAAWLALFNPVNLVSWPRLRSLLAALVADRRRVSAGLAATHYQRVRELAAVGGTFTPRLAPEPPAEQVEASLDATGIAAYATAIRAGQDAEQARRTAAVTVSGSVTRMVLDGGRQTVHGAVDADREAVGYIRITDGDPCAFCAMLASRGPVYKTQATAGDPRGGGKRYHDHDACIAVPVFRGSDEPWVRRSEDLYDQWLRVTAGHSGADARRVWRRHWENREA